MKEEEEKLKQMENPNKEKINHLQVLRENVKKLQYSIIFKDHFNKDQYNFHENKINLDPEYNERRYQRTLAVKRKWMEYLKTELKEKYKI